MFPSEDKKLTAVQASQNKAPIVLNTPAPTSYQLVMDPRVASLIVNNSPAKPSTLQVANVNSPSMGPPSTRAPRRTSAGKKTVVAKPSVPVPITATPPSPTISTRSAVVAATKQTSKRPAAQPLVPTPPATRSRQTGTVMANSRPTESTVEGGLTTGTKPKQIVDLTADDGRPAPDSREIAFNKLQGKTYPSLVVVARPNLRVTDVNIDRNKLDAKVKSILMYPPAKFTEWLIQQGLIKSAQVCVGHKAKQMNLGMYSDVSKFPHSGGYVWIAECCPQRFVSVFSGSIFEGSPHPPLVVLKVLYHWACQTNIPNILQWVKVDNFFVKGMYTSLRAVCTIAVQTHARKLGRSGVTVEVGVISLGTTSQDGTSRQVKVEVLGVLETSTKLIRLKAIEPTSDGERNVKKRFSRILEPLIQWVNPTSTIVTDMTVDKATLNQMGFANVVQPNVADNSTNKNIMDYLRRIVPRMFQNTLSLLSRHIIQQFLDELVWREWYGTTSMLAFNNLIQHLSEQTTLEKASLTNTLNKVSQNPFKDWSINVAHLSSTSSSIPAATPANIAAKVPAVPVKPTFTGKPQETYAKKRKRKDPAESTQKPAPSTQVEPSRPPKPISPDVPEQMVPLEHYYYGTIDHYARKTNVKVLLKCPYCKDTFNNNVTLMHHLFKHAQNDKDGEMCKYCLTTVATSNDLLKHIAQAHPVETKHENAFVCLICETSFNNPFILGKHMSKDHFPSELPYQCGTCGYMCSNHKQAIDHFYKQHEKGPTIQCPFCLKSTTIFSTSRNIVQNMQFFMQHLQKHQKKQMAKKCGKCNLWFFTKELLKDHQTKMHVSQRGNKNLVPWVAPRNGVMVPKSKMDKYPCDAEGIDFSILSFSISKGYVCRECDLPMDSVKHFPSFETCTSCQYSSCCEKAMQKHRSECNKNSQLNIPKDPLPWTMYCICGYSIDDGNQMAQHLAICEKKSAYPSLTDAEGASVTHSMLDVLGLVRKPEESDKKKTSETVTLEDESEDAIPAESETTSSKDINKEQVVAQVSISEKVDESLDTVEKGEIMDTAPAESEKMDVDDELKDKIEDKDKIETIVEVPEEEKMDVDIRNEEPTNEANTGSTDPIVESVIDASDDVVEKTPVPCEIGTVDEENAQQDDQVEESTTFNAPEPDSIDADHQGIVASESQTTTETEPQEIAPTETQSTVQTISPDAASEPMNENIASPETQSSIIAESDPQDVDLTENIASPETDSNDVPEPAVVSVSEPQDVDTTENILTLETQSTTAIESPDAAENIASPEIQRIQSPDAASEPQDNVILQTESIVTSDGQNTSLPEREDMDTPEQNVSESQDSEPDDAVLEPQDVAVAPNTSPQIITTSETDNIPELETGNNANLDEHNIASDAEKVADSGENIAVTELPSTSDPQAAVDECLSV